MTEARAEEPPENQAEEQRAGEGPGSRAAASRFVALVNPVAGSGHALRAWQEVAGRLTAAGAATETCLTRGRTHAAEAAAEAAERGAVVVAVGGDGLVRDAVCGAAPHGAALGIVPAGRGNDLAGALGLPRDPGVLARALLAGNTRRIDLLETGGTLVPGNVYAGIDSVATGIINGARWMPARLLYRLAPVRALATWRPVTWRLSVDGGAVRTVRGHTVVVGNSGRYGHGLRIVPSARLDDGLLDVLTVGEEPRRRLPAFMREARTGRHVARDSVQVRPGREVTLEADRPVPLCADGDCLGGLPATVRLRPAALRVITPG